MREPASDPCVQYHKYLFKDDDESLSKQYHMLPKKRLKKEMEQGDNDTFLLGERAVISFKRSLQVHMAPILQEQIVCGLADSPDHQEEALPNGQVNEQTFNSQGRATKPESVIGNIQASNVILTDAVMEDQGPEAGQRVAESQKPGAEPQASPQDIAGDPDAAKNPLQD